MNQISGIKDLLLVHGNNICAECREPNTSYASVHLGIFLCPICAKYHQKLGGKFNNVSNVQTHRFTEDELDALQSRGNTRNNIEYEKHVPLFYHRPGPEDPPILYEQWVRAKYEREEFKYISQQSSYDQGTKTGSLFKRAKDQDKFQRRKFVLSEPDGNLMYYIKYSDRSPKDSISMKDIINIYMIPSKIGNENGMQITYEKGGQRRNLYIFAQDGKTASDWYHSIRSSLMRHKYKEFSKEDAKRYLDSRIIREGWMNKTGPTRMEKFRRRWFSLEGSAIWYYAQPLDAHPLGSIPLGSKTFGYSIAKGFPKDVKIDGHGLTIQTPDRGFVLDCLNAGSRERWYKAITKVIDSFTTIWTPMPEGSGIGKSPTKDKVIVIDDLEDLPSPSTTTVFTDLHGNAGNQINQTINTNGVKPAPRVGLFEKKGGNNTKSGAVINKINSNHNMAPKRTDTVKALVKEFPVQSSKRYSDDSSLSSEGGDLVTTSMDGSTLAHPKAAELLEDIQKNRQLSSTTDDDSEEECIVLDDRKRNEIFDAQNHHRTLYDSNPKRPNKRNMSSSSIEVNIEQLHSPSHSRQKHSPVFEHMTPVAALRTTGDRKPRPVSGPMPKLGTSTSSSGSPTGTPKKPPRRTKMNSASSTGSDLDKNSLHSSREDVSRYRPHSPSPLIDQTEDQLQVQTSMAQLGIDEGKWRKMTFTSQRRVQGNERQTIKKPHQVDIGRNNSTKRGSTSSSSSSSGQQRPIDIIITNHIDESIWFLLFQCEADPSEIDSYTTPWIGAEIAETPASVGPIKLPSEFEIAVVDTAPGGYGLQRTTGPFYAESGDVWEVDMPVDDGSAPVMFYHEGMETDNGSVMVYNNIQNSKKFEVAVYKNGRKLFSRRNTKPGEAFSFTVKPVLYIAAVNQETFMDLEGDDIRVSDIIPNATPVEISDKISKVKIAVKKRGDTIYFQSHLQKSSFTHSSSNSIPEAPPINL